MSGGVDSSVAAALLKNQGFKIIGVFMEVYTDSILESGVMHHACFGPDEKDDLRDAKKVAEILKIPFHTIDLKKEYKTNIIDFVVEEYSNGNTPNPCIKCNKELKFNAIINELNRRRIRFDYFATGHYAQVEYDMPNRTAFLKKATDLKKDQSYFLYHLKDHQLEKTIFPLGKYTKEEIRELARKFKLAVSDKKESQDFIAGGYHQLFKDRNPGPILNSQGEIKGEHRGLVFYTIGQRKGIGISSIEPFYVVKKDQIRNALIVGTKDKLLGKKLIAKDLNWINFSHLNTSLNVKARIRYHHKEAEATVIPYQQNKVMVNFLKPQLAITPGQSIVFYHYDKVIGGGIIERQVKNEHKREAK